MISNTQKKNFSTYVTIELKTTTVLCTKGIRPGFALSKFNRELPFRSVYLALLLPTDVADQPGP